MRRKKYRQSNIKLHKQGSTLKSLHLVFDYIPKLNFFILVSSIPNLLGIYLEITHILAQLPTL